VIYFIILLAISAVIFVFINYTSGQIIEPIKELTEVTELISQGNLSRDLRGGVGGSTEIVMLYNTFRGLVTALRFGNDDYYAGNISRAKNNYQAALELFESLDNQKGIGICYNNLANIYRAQGNLKDANTYYREAIDIARILYENADDEDKPEHAYALASRLNNLALLYLAIEEYDRAEQMLQEALEYDREIDNSRGFATRYGNLGQVYIAQSKLDKAESVFNEAYEIAVASDSDRILAYATMNRGLYHKAVGDFDEATESFLKAVKLAEDLDIRVQISSLQNLEEIYESTGQTELAQEISNRIEDFNRAKMQIKEITFVLDYSGSMAGKRIKSALRGIKNIYKDQTNPNDIVSLITFSTNSRVIFEPDTKEGTEKKFMKLLARLTKPGGGTAFYDALKDAFDDYYRRPSPNDQWIIALTDGDDNQSKTKISEIEKLARHSVGVNLIVIGVGDLKMRDYLEKICRLTDKGQYINVRDGVADAITTAFEEVSTMLAEVEVEGFVSDY
jgi:tetratricopeptide (TPR) repeat protein